MNGRPLMLATLLGASIGVPYVASRSGSEPSTGGSPTHAPQAKSSWSLPSWAAGNSTAPTPPPLSTAGPPPSGNPLSIPAPAEVTRYHSIPEVLRFNLSKEWVYQNWERKSTGLADPELFGIRVQLVTGTARTDLAGSLTYHFDGVGQLQHISFRGRTADTTQLIQFLTHTYQFQRMEAPAGEQLYQVRSGSNVYSELRTRPESVLVETAPLSSFGVVLELGRPGTKRVLKPPVPHLDIPPAASTPAPSTAKTANSDSDGKGASDEPGLVGKVRQPTTEETSTLQHHRWPN